MVGGIIAGLALAETTLPGLAPVMFLAAAAGIVVRGMGNLLDGMVAVESGKASPLGELFNEVPDRVSDIAILIGAAGQPAATPRLACRHSAGAPPSIIRSPFGSCREFCWRCWSPRCSSTDCSGVIGFCRSSTEN